MVISLYTDLEDFEAQHGNDFSTLSWAPEDKVIYHATDKSFASSASRMINEYCLTVFSDFPDCDETITVVCNEIILRMIRRRNAINQAMGHESFTDDFMTVNVAADQLTIELSDNEKYQLDKFRAGDIGLITVGV
jgi:hypothetical protein